MDKKSCATPGCGTTWPNAFFYLIDNQYFITLFRNGCADRSQIGLIFYILYIYLM